MHRSVTVCFVVALLTAGLAGGALLAADERATPVVGVASASVTDEAGATGGAAVDAAIQPRATTDPAATDPATERLQEEPQSFDRTRFEVVVHSNGSATWTFRHDRTLESADEIDQFESYAETFETEETEQYERFTESATALTASGENYTSREMEAIDFDRRARIDRGFNTRGVVEMSFTWTNFATVGDDGRVVVSDVFAGGLPLVSDQRLQIEPGDGLAFDEVAPEADAGYTGDLRDANAVWWDGPYEFGDGQPHVVLVPANASASTGGSGGTGITDNLSAAAGVFLVAIAGLVAFAWYRFGSPSSDIDSLVGGSAPIPGSDQSEDGVREDTAITSEELMTDEDRVVALIERNGGRMKQVDIVEETGWSKSKVSMLLSEMADDGTVSKLRVGRENIISLDGFEPEATKSPFDE